MKHDQPMRYYVKGTSKDKLIIICINHFQTYYKTKAQRLSCQYTSDQYQILWSLSGFFIFIISSEVFVINPLNSTKISQCQLESCPPQSAPNIISMIHRLGRCELNNFNTWVGMIPSLRSWFWEQPLGDFLKKQDITILSVFHGQEILFFLFPTLLGIVFIFSKTFLLSSEDLFRAYTYFLATLQTTSSSISS